MDGAGEIKGKKKKKLTKSVPEKNPQTRGKKIFEANDNLKKEHKVAAKGVFFVPSRRHRHEVLKRSQVK